MPAQSPTGSRGSGTEADTDRPATSGEQPTEPAQEAAAGGVTEGEGGSPQRRQMTAADRAALRRKLRDKFH